MDPPIDSLHLQFFAVAREAPEGLTVIVASCSNPIDRLIPVITVDRAVAWATAPVPVPGELGRQLPYISSSSVTFLLKCEAVTSVQTADPITFEADAPLPHQQHSGHERLKIRLWRHTGKQVSDSAFRPIPSRNVGRTHLSLRRTSTTEEHLLQEPKKKNCTSQRVQKKS